MVFNAIFNIISIISQEPFFPGVLINSASDNSLLKPLAAFPHNHDRNNGRRREKNKSCYYHQSSERMSEEWGIEPAISSYQVFYDTDGSMGLSCTNENI